MIIKNYIKTFSLYILLITSSLSAINWRDYMPNFGIQSHLFSLGSSANKCILAVATVGTAYGLYRYNIRKKSTITLSTYNNEQGKITPPSYDEQKKDYERYIDESELDSIDTFKHAVNSLANLKGDYKNRCITIAKHLQTIARYSHRADVRVSDEFTQLKSMSKLSKFIELCEKHKKNQRFPYAASKEKTSQTLNPLWYWDNVKATIENDFLPKKIMTQDEFENRIKTIENYYKNKPNYENDQNLQKVCESQIKFEQNSWNDHKKIQNEYEKRKPKTFDQAYAIHQEIAQLKEDEVKNTISSFKE